MFRGLNSVFCLLLISKPCVSLLAKGGPLVPCVTSCTGFPDGNYHSCNGCNVFASCTGGHLEDNRPCPLNLEFDAFSDSCVGISSSCDFIEQPIEPPPPSSCISSCAGKADGDYGSCIACHKFATCSSGAITDDQLCPKDKVWDNSVRQCLDASSTCNCIRKCDGLQDGNYHSCTSCQVFASCSGGSIIDNRPCGAATQYDAKKDTCTGASSTCP